MRTALPVRTLLLFASPALASAPCQARAAVLTQEYGITFCNVGAPGNAAFQTRDFLNRPLSIGAVGHEYRMAQTELSVGQWAEFVTAWTPYGTNLNGPAFTGEWIQNFGGVYLPTPGSTGYAADMSWRYAAMYCNWLHNDKRPERWAFESGAYDITTFTANPEGGYNDQRTHSPDAKFWIPSLDEWIKATYYDPDQGGTGVGGYWQHPGASDSPLISGRPENGGTTSAGMASGVFPYLHNVGIYPGSQSPWGLLDVSGGRREWTESGPGGGARYSVGSTDRDQDWLGVDTLSSQEFRWFLTSPDSGRSVGLRLAAKQVPAPGVALTGACAGWVTFYRRRS